MLYWGEGAKRDLSFCNSDPGMIRMFAHCLLQMGVNKEDLKITVRIYEDIEKRNAVSFWSRTLGMPVKQISNVNVLKGRKKGKLKYGMCRIRVRKGGFYLKTLQSIIQLVKENYIRPS